MIDKNKAAGDIAGAVETNTEVIQPEDKDAARPTVNFVNIPQELKTSCLFCLWKRERRKGGMTKVPYDPKTRNMAKTNDSKTFADFNTTMKAYVMGSADATPYEGIGIKVSNGIGAIDIDHCIRDDGSLNDVAASILSIFPDTYFERSPSGSGLRGFFKVDPDYVFDKTVYYINNRKLGLEVYLPGTTNRFVTVTGNVYRAGAVTLDMDALEKTLDSFMKRKTPVKTVSSHFNHVSYLSDEEVIAHATRAVDEDGNPTAAAQRFKDYLAGDWQKYFDNQSDADMSFISSLCFWCGCNEEQIDRIYRSSGMMRPKWDRKQAGTTYGAITIRNAVALCKDVYTPIHVGADQDFDEMDDGGGSDEKETEKDKPAFTPDLSRITASLDDLKPQSNERYGSGEMGLGYLFADYYRPIARFNASRGIWFVYDGKVWMPDEGDLAVSELAKNLADELYRFALNIKTEGTRKEYIERVVKLQQRRNRKTMIEDAKSVYPVTVDWFDRDPYLFNCINGTLDLKTLEFKAHDPADFLTKLSGVSYDASADCERWHSFINEVMCGDEEEAKFFQKSLGYALTGDTRRECLFILYGPTSRNGKGTAMETFLKIMGDYGKTSNPEMLGTKFNANSSGPSEEIARLAGVRFVNISEPEKKITFNSALVKRLTGNDTINARFLHENSFDFKPVFKIFINTNYRPTVNDLTLFTSERINVIPFNRHFEDNEQDKGLKEFLSQPANLSGIFNWCLEGQRLLNAEGLKLPESVQQANDEYREESDRIGQFINECLEVGHEEDGTPFEVRSSAAYGNYKAWCEANHYYAENVKNFNNAMTTEGKFSIKRKRPRDGGGQTTMLIGCRLAKDEDGQTVVQNLWKEQKSQEADDDFSVLM